MVKKKITCVISCFNEAKNFRLLFNEIKKYKLLSKYDFIIINNGSTDNSIEVLRKLKKKIRNFSIINVKDDLGFGNGIRTGLLKARGDIVGWTHGDLQYSMIYLLRAYDLIKKKKFFSKKKSFLKGSRFDRRITNVFFSQFMGLICSLILGIKIREINSQPIFFNKNIIKKIKKYPNDLSMDMFMYYKLLENSFTEFRFPVKQIKRIHGESSWEKNIFSNFKLAITFILRAIQFRLKIYF